MSVQFLLPFSPKSTSFVAASPAPTCPAPASVEDSAPPKRRQRTRGSGSSSTDSSARSGRGGSSSKTWRAGQAGGCPECDEPLGHGAMTACPWASRPLRLAPDTDESGSSSSPDLPTLLSPKENYNRKGLSARSGDGLVTALRRHDGILPTLSASEESRGPVNKGERSKSGRTLREGLMPTLTSSSATRGKAARGQNAQGGPSLGEVLLPTLCSIDSGTGRVNQGGHQGRVGVERPSLARLLPTLTMSDGTKAPRFNGFSSTGEKNPTIREALAPLAKRASAPASGTLLSPRWCELFMGFPPGWTVPLVPPDGPPPADLRPKKAKRS